MTDEAQAQYWRNKETIARFCGFLPDTDDPREEPMIMDICEECRNQVPIIELRRNNNICDHCCDNAEAT